MQGTQLPLVSSVSDVYGNKVNRHENVLTVHLDITMHESSPVTIFDVEKWYWEKVGVDEKGRQRTVGGSL